MQPLNLINQLIQLVFSRENIRPENIRYYFASQQVFLAAFVLHILFISVFIAFEIKELIYFNVFSLLVFIAALYLNKKGHHEAALWSAYLEVNIHAVLAVALVGWAAGFFYYLLAIGPMLFFYPRYRLHLKIIPAIISAAILVKLYIYSLENPANYILTSDTLLYLYIFNMISIFALLAHLAHYYTAGADQSEAQLRKLSEKFKKLAILDPLTSLLNRRATTQKLTEEISRFNRNRKPFCLVIGDIDNFKSYNDKYGHRGGDEVIKQVATLLTENTRGHDVCSRWGGEEFLIIFPDCNLAEASQITEKLRQTISSHSIEYNNNKITLTMSFGLCEFSQNSNLENAIEAADKALYHAKHQGKDRVEIAELDAQEEYINNRQHL